MLSFPRAEGVESSRVSLVEMSERSGSVLCGKWQIGRLLGVGGMSAVYDAVHRNGRRVAIKVLRPELCLNPRARRRFLREGYIANRVGHPGAVSILDDGVAEDGTVFLVMELLEGLTLGACVREAGRLPPDQVLACADRVLDILASAHRNGIIHRDIKPENLFLTRESTLKLLDFGISSVRELSTSGIGTTRWGAQLGTPAFMAPEQARGRPDQIDRRTDLWALGATMYTLLTGRHVHEGFSSNEVLIAAATREPCSVSAFAPNLEPAVSELIDVCLRLDINERWSDARTMQRELRQRSNNRPLALPTIPDTEGGSLSGTEIATFTSSQNPSSVDRSHGRRPRTQPSAGPRRWLRGLHASAIGALALGVGLTLMASRGGDRAEPGRSSAVLANAIPKSSPPVNAAAPPNAMASTPKDVAAETTRQTEPATSSIVRRPAPSGRGMPKPRARGPGDSSRAAAPGSVSGSFPGDPLRSDVILDRRE
jgi:eukaryotic-like serine/threonine-protein kinase